MLRVTIELVPLGVEGAKRTLKTLEIRNDGTGTPEVGNYDVRVDGGKWQQSLQGWKRRDRDVLDFLDNVLWDMGYRSGTWNE